MVMESFTVTGHISGVYVMIANEIVLYQDGRQGISTITVKDMLERAKSLQLKHAGFGEMEYLLAHPEAAPSTLTDKPENGQRVALLFCDVIVTHGNGSQYVPALIRGSTVRLEAEKYWLADPLPATFYVALLH